jgi:mxaK protein
MNTTTSPLWQQLCKGLNLVRQFFTTTKLTWLLVIVAIVSAVNISYEINRIHQINAFNTATSHGKPPKTDTQSFEAKFATAYWLAKNERYKESTLLFTHLAENATAPQKAAILYNVGNIFFLRGIAINGTNGTVRNETEYLFTQAKTSYLQSLRLDNNHWDVRHNLDRILTIVRGDATPGVGESDTPGLIMGNIPVGLP